MEFTGKTVEEAKQKGLAELGISEEQAEITIVEESVKGLFGKIKKEAVVDVKAKSKGVDAAAEFLSKLLKVMDVNAKVNVTDEKTITLIAEDSSAVIGYRGEVLDAMQTLAGAVANIGNKEYKKVVVDCENYRDRREDTLVSLAHKLETKATETRRIVILEPMSPFERRIIHTALADSETVKTSSEGKEPNRYVVITPNDLDETARPYNAGANHGKNRRDGGRRNEGKDRRGNRGFKGRGHGNGRSSGFTEEKRKTSSGFGTYLGNSLKDKNY
ncbi:MAG: protein jag [Clostridia bacterium]|nr:protein jag [Clostridia bacterium]